MMSEKREALKRAKRIVVKVGTSTLTYSNCKLKLHRIEQLVRELADLANGGREIVLVSSGAIAVGMDRMGLKNKPTEVPAKQALAAVGQGVLMHVYEKLFAEYGQTAAQVLLTKENSVRHNQYHHSRNALLALFKMGVIPVINENDAVSVDELKIGDNDTLSATVATLVDADLLIILSDIDGLYDANPQTHPEAKLIHEVREITPEIEQIAGGAGTATGTGGMFTKIQAAKISMSSGVPMVITSGEQDGMVRAILTGEEIGTLFPAKEAHLKVRKSWLAFGRSIEGDLHVDEGCARAMCQRGSSLLAAGITKVAGEFAAKASVRVLDPTGREVARGVVSYDAETLRRIKGLHSNELEQALDGQTPLAVIHRDNMVLLA